MTTLTTMEIARSLSDKVLAYLPTAQAQLDYSDDEEDLLPLLDRTVVLRLSFQGKHLECRVYSTDLFVIDDWEFFSGLKAFIHIIETFLPPFVKISNVSFSYVIYNSESSVFLCCTDASFHWCEDLSTATMFNTEEEAEEALKVARVVGEIRGVTLQERG